MGKKTRVAGMVLHVLIGGLMIFLGTAKLTTKFPPEAMEQMAKMGVDDKLVLLGVGEVVTGILLIIPLTTSLGVLLTSGFFGGVICIHLTHNDSIIPGCVLLILTWVGAFLRDKRQFASFFPKEA